MADHERRTVAHEWDAFRPRIPGDVSPAQYRDMRRAFYIGARAMLQLLAEQDLTDRGIVMTVRRDYVIGLVQEVADFASHVNSGRG